MLVCVVCVAFCTIGLVVLPAAVAVLPSEPRHEAIDITDEAEASEEADEAPADEDDELLLLLLLPPNRLLQRLLSGGELETECDLG